MNVNRKLARIGGKIFTCLVMGVIITISVFPFIWVFISSFKTQFQIMSEPLAMPQSWSLVAYIRALTATPIVIFYRNSIILATVSTILTLIIVGMSAYVVAKYTFRGQTLVIVMFSSCLLIPSISLSYPVFRMIKTLGLYDSLAGLVLVNVAFGLPVTFFIMRSYFLTIPRELSESAAIDGAGFARTFISVIVPMAKPAFAAAGTFQFMWVWNEFYFSMLLTSSDECRTLPLSLNYFMAQFSADYPAMFAAVIMVVTPTILVYSLMQKQVINGLTAGAVKG
ncbi:MAG: carbohydrate ABC transporter permease [Lachnospiraceae bacterium]|nr:carbohydrate ABC transporter permease [Lachnospiraceae bacterium]